jgi:hypothetical protein
MRPLAFLCLTGCFLFPSIDGTEHDGLVGDVTAVDPPADPLGDTPTLDPCVDGLLGEGEVDLDCGGACAPCAVGAICWSDADCADRCDETIGVCTDAPSCDDGAWGPGEADVDCGGPCSPCDDGSRCDDGSDCRGGACLDEICAADPDATCRDGARNQGEADVDCGGGVCPPCSTGATCETWSDCASGACDDVCVGAGEATCADGQLGGDEAAVDCGGSCDPCLVGATCDDAADCASGVCDGVCLPIHAPSCHNGRQDGREAGVDCGGDCASCPEPVHAGDRDEGFETGDLSAFPWSTTGPAVTEGDCAEGRWCVRGDGTLTLPLRVRADDELGFFANVGRGGSLTARWDGAVVWASGETDGFVPVSFPVPATPPDAPPSTLRFEMYGAALDRISLPRLDLPIGAPTRSAPGDAALVAAAPWLTADAVDPDGDAPIWEYEWADNPALSGSSRVVSDGPARGPEGGPWFWRARAWTAYDHTPTAWTDVAAWDIDPAGGVGWRGAVLSAGVAPGLTWGNSAWNNPIRQVTATAGPVPLGLWGAETMLDLDVGDIPAGLQGDLTLSIAGDLDGDEEWIAVEVDGAWVADLRPGTCALTETPLEIPVNPGLTRVTLLPTGWVNGGCTGGDEASATLDVTVATAATWSAALASGATATATTLTTEGAGSRRVWLIDATGVQVGPTLTSNGPLPAAPTAARLVVELAPGATLTRVQLSPR